MANEEDPRFKWYQNIAVPIAAQIIVLAGVVGVPIITSMVDDKSSYCTTVRGQVVEQAEAEPLILDAPYAEDSEEQESCKINSFLVDLGGEADAQPSTSE